jgi:peptidoglycan/xylan/chitin deacetylase (PgdA/CDA1 family)
MKKKLIDFYKSVLGFTEFAIGGWNYPKDELVVLCMHSTPADQEQAFFAMLEFILKQFKPLDPAALNDYFDGKLSNGPYVLFTFDDGLKNNLHVAKWLESKGIHAYFFLVPAFMLSDEPINYYRKNIRQLVDHSFDKLDDDFSPMNVGDINKLIQAGHKVGSHTYTHLMRKESDEKALLHEIVDSKNELERVLNIPADAFCSPINSAISVSSSAKALIAKNYEFHFTTFPGLHSELREKQLIFRRNIEVNWPLNKIKFALGQWDLRRWKPVLEEYWRS